MATQKKPSKSILKSSSSFDKPESDGKRSKMKWDEMNILATYHPEGKDYGHQKIDEPPTPYNRDHDESSDQDDLDPDALAKKLENATNARSRTFSEGDSDSPDEDETPEERAKRKQFETKRKKHYNEFHAMKLAKKLMDEEDKDEQGPSKTT